VLRARLEAAGLSRLICVTSEAIFLDRGEVPVEAAALLGDIAALPCSPARYNAVAERALNQAGVSMFSEQERRQRAGVGDQRIAAGEPHRVRVVLDDGAEMRAEEDAAAAEEARPTERRTA
jgi:hypothetical protein